MLLITYHILTQLSHPYHTDVSGILYNSALFHFCILLFFSSTDTSTCSLPNILQSTDIGEKMGSATAEYTSYFTHFKKAYNDTI
jgi:hypothetical protein